MVHSKWIANNPYFHGEISKDAVKSIFQQEFNKWKDFYPEEYFLFIYRLNNAGEITLVYESFKNIQNCEKLIEVELKMCKYCQIHLRGFCAECDKDLTPHKHEYWIPIRNKNPLSLRVLAKLSLLKIKHYDKREIPKNLHNEVKYLKSYQERKIDEISDIWGLCFLLLIGISFLIPSCYLLVEAVFWGLQSYGIQN